MEIERVFVVLPAFALAAVACIFIMYLHNILKKARVGKDLVESTTASGAESGTGPMGGELDKLSKQIKDGAKAFLMEEYKWLAVFVGVMAFILLIIFSVDTVDGDGGTKGVRTAGAFIIGAFLSAAAGWLGMMVATDGNVRTTVACAESDLNAGLKIAFTTGGIMGFTVGGLGLGGVAAVFIICGAGYDDNLAFQVLAGFGFGASSIALFARVAGGIYTKAADVGADLVGKVEAGIDEDDPHNPAVIADNVGDNVGDVAGMGADLFESFVGSIIASATLADSDKKIALPFYLASAGIFCSMIGMFFVSTSEKGEGKKSNLSALMWALEKGMYVACVLFIVAAALICWLLEDMWGSFSCVLVGLISGVAIGKLTEYFTSFDFAPVQSIKDRGKTGPATVVIQGLGVGMLSCVPPVVVLVVCILACSEIQGTYGISIAAVGMLATLGITLATDAYGPVADNAGGLAEMDPSIPASVRDKTDALDALGNTTAATGKGFAIGSAVLTSLSLLAAFKEQANLTPAILDVGEPTVLAGVLFGAMLPYMFAALTMISVGKAAAEIIQEVRRQFQDIPGLVDIIKIGLTEQPITADYILKVKKGKKVDGVSGGIDIDDYTYYCKASDDASMCDAKAGEIVFPKSILPDSDKCVAISTRSSVREMIAPGAYAILAPLFVGFTVGPRCLMGVLVGSISSGCMVAIMMSNAGGAWDNGKKLCEKLDIKKTDQGVACIVGDTVGDPFKDTSGPALNILLKLMSMVSLTIAPLIKLSDDPDAKLDYKNFYFGFIPLVVFVAVTMNLVVNKILTWEDPLGNLIPSEVKVEENQLAEPEKEEDLNSTC
jgi:inorganic pyrophosphatase